MFDSTPDLQDPASPAADDAPDPAVLRAERRLRLLEELSEIGMELARALRPGAADVDASGEGAAATARAKTRDPAEAFGSLSRAIRLTLTLEAKTDAELRDLKAGIVRARTEERVRATERARVAAAEASKDRTERIFDLVLEAADADCEFLDNESFATLHDAIEHLLAEDAFYADGQRPLRESVERLCRQLAIEPDWRRWTGEGWVMDDEIAARCRVPIIKRPGFNAATLGAHVLE